MTSSTARPPHAIHRNILRTFFSPAPWAATAYLASYLPVGTALFCCTAVTSAICFGLGLTWLVFPLLIGAATIARGCAQVERTRARLVAGRVEARYAPPPAAGIMTRARARWSDHAVRRDFAYLLVMFVPLLVLDAATLVVWLTLLAGLTLPLWFWSIPMTWPDGRTTHGVKVGYVPGGPHISWSGFWVGNIGTALLVAAISFVLALFAAYLVIGAARLHGFVAKSLLGPWVDPLAEAKSVLEGPGPLSAPCGRPSGCSGLKPDHEQNPAHR
jgi:hypothetical protein